MYRLPLLAIFVSAAAPLLGSGAVYVDADDDATHAAARRALATAKVLPMEARTLSIEGLLLGVSGTAVDLQGSLQQLGAKVTQQEITIQLSADVLFDFDKHDLKPGALPALRKLGAVLAAYPKAPVRIDGHTDSVGKDIYNQTLSEQRALAVKDWLVANAQADGTRMTTRGWGKSRPAAPNAKPDGSDDPAGRQKNRRVEITIVKQ